MMHLRTFVYIGMLVFAALPLPAMAKSASKEVRWAQCLWTNVPKTADNWLSSPNQEADMFSEVKTPGELLQFRLQGACTKILSIENGGKNVGFNAKRVRGALISSRPSIIESDKVDPRAFSCIRFFENDTVMAHPAQYIWGFGDLGNGTVLANVGLEFAGVGGRGIRLAATGGLRKCRWIKEDGTLTDA